MQRKTIICAWWWAHETMHGQILVACIVEEPIHDKDPIGNL